MTRAHQVVGVALLVAALAVVAKGTTLRPVATVAGSPGGIDAAQRAAGLSFDAGVGPADQQAILDAIAAARPETQRLIAIVDGLVTVRVGAPAAGHALGTTQGGGDMEGYEVVVDLGRVVRENGPRGISRLVLHELGHVVDHALLSAEVQRTLDAGIPAGVVCENGVVGACATREERFAETFAKWATNDVGHNLYIGYKVPPPPSLDAWGAPLAQVD